MSWITMFYGAMAVIASTLAGIYLAAWVTQPNTSAYLMFVLLAVSMCGVAVIELWMLQARTPEEYALAMRLWQVPLWSGICAFVGLVHLRLRPRFSWVGWLAAALRTLALVANFSSGSSLNYAVLTGIDRVWLFGEPLAIATGVPNPWMLLGQVSNLLLAIFILDGGVRAWRRGERQRALSLALSLLIPVALGTIQAVLVYWGFVQMPVMIAPLLLFIALAMGYELSDGLLRAARAEREVRSLDVSLKRSALRLRLAAEAADVGFWSVDAESGAVWATAKTRELFGLAPAGDVRLSDVLERVYWRDREGLKRAIEAALRSHDLHRSEFRVLDADGKVRWLVGLGRALLETEAARRTLMGVTVDITDRKAMADAIRRQRVRLEHLSRVETLSELSACLAHELNQPLAVILTNAEAAQSLLRRTPPDLTEIGAILTDIVGADRRATDVIRRLRALLDRGEPERETLSVNDAITRVLGLIGGELDDQSVSISLSLAASLPAVRADGILIDQVLLNLLTNAAEAVADNRPHDRRLSVTTFFRSNGVSIAIADNGCGAANPRRIFNAFYSTKPGRLGMGLAIVRSVVKSHGGRVWAESATGRGTTIYLSLPKDGSPP